ncbi:MAG: dUTP diphosphatase [Methanobrevibacter sp.]|nr:dUTP diphosphatase [Methanobrevibacter sp.]
MNITHAVDEEVKGDKLKAIFDRQKELMEKYHDIELKSGLMQTEQCPVNLDDKKGQARIKDFSWRVIEEVGEALDALEQDDMVHYSEELIDGLHFLTELTILSGYDYNSFFDVEYKDCLSMLIDDASNFSCINDAVSKLVKDLGMMCNCLKNKPWKQTNMVTDKSLFFSQLNKVWRNYIGLLNFTLTCDDIVNIYLKKSQVNKFRQRSNY